MVNKEDLPGIVTNKDFGRKVKMVTIPLPAVSYNPTEGGTYGALTAFLLHNKYGEVSSLIAPQINYNENYGVTGTIYMALYPLPERSWEINLSQSEKVNNDYEVKFRDKTFLGGKLELRAFAFKYTDGSARFFGFGPDSRFSSETDFGDDETGFAASAAYNIARSLQVVVYERLRRVDIIKGAVTTLPFTKDRFSASRVPGLNGFISHAQGIGFIYSTLAPRAIPLSGTYARATFEASSKILGSAANYQIYEGEFKRFIQAHKGRYITVVRVSASETVGNNAPFLDRSILGGENTLRGYGRNRFIDKASMLLNLEERIRMFRWRLFNVDSDWEVAPFLDYGAVMPSLGSAALSDFKPCPGVGFRAVIRPNIVGRVDLGIGQGLAAFVTLGYPF